jgi:hypothetical protein
MPFPLALWSRSDLAVAQLGGKNWRIKTIACSTDKMPVGPTARMAVLRRGLAARPSMTPYQRPLEIAGISRFEEWSASRSGLAGLIGPAF